MSKGTMQCNGACRKIQEMLEVILTLTHNISPMELQRQFYCIANINVYFVPLNSNQTQEFNFASRYKVHLERNEMYVPSTIKIM